MKKFYTIISLIIIANNLSIFIYGLWQNYNADSYIEKTKLQLLETSALSIAKHILEDMSFNNTITQEIIYNKSKIILTINKTDKSLISVDVNIINNNKNYFSSFINKENSY